VNIADDRTAGPRAGGSLFYDRRMHRHRRLVLLSRRPTGYVSFDLLRTLRTGRAHGKFEVFTSALILGMGIADPNRLNYALEHEGAWLNQPRHCEER
jgi:hypothetical protein